jgi:hypothetical protein
MCVWVCMSLFLSFGLASSVLSNCGELSQTVGTLCEGGVGSLACQMGVGAGRVGSVSVLESGRGLHHQTRCATGATGGEAGKARNGRHDLATLWHRIACTLRTLRPPLLLSLPLSLSPSPAPPPPASFSFSQRLYLYFSSPFFFFSLFHFPGLFSYATPGVVVVARCGI